MDLCLVLLYFYTIQALSCPQLDSYCGSPPCGKWEYLKSNQAKSYCYHRIGKVIADADLCTKKLLLNWNWIRITSHYCCVL